MNITIEQMAEKLKASEEIRIIYHIRPDGDCIGSAFALALALQAAGVRCDVRGRDEIPHIHRPMTDLVPMDELHAPLYLAVDCAAPARTGTYEQEHFTFCIDHHQNNSIDADWKYVEPDCGACSEIVFKIIKAMGVEVTKLMADFLYTALVTDTMCFRTSDTDQQSFATAAELAGLGADIFGIGRRNMFIKTPQRIKIEKILTDSFRFTCDDRIVTGIITLDDLKRADILDSELEGINSLAERIAGIRVAVTIRELPDGRTRCSTRTSGSIAANELCAVHGGGGHFHAACCDLDTDPLTAREIMERTAREFLEKENAQ
ncbi:MAG: DHH family phosphoesterase [Oscillospiraceae bacterium]|nr:DHH family phosphoesterase [Oscillospiraceae bacterium]